MFRPIIGIIICCLPLAHDLDVTEVLSIIMALFAFTVLWENITSLQRGAKFWESWEGTDYPKASDTIGHASSKAALSEVDEGDLTKSHA